jgi:hypothetical protein
VVLGSRELVEDESAEERASYRDFRLLFASLIFNPQLSSVKRSAVPVPLSDRKSYGTLLAVLIVRTKVDTTPNWINGQ